MKKPFVIILLLFIMLTSVGCYSSNDSKLEINQIESLTFEIGDEIPLIVRMMMNMDAFDAITDPKRAYQAQAKSDVSSLEFAIDIMYDNSQKTNFPSNTVQFDEKCSYALLLGFKNSFENNEEFRNFWLNRDKQYFDERKSYLESQGMEVNLPPLDPASRYEAIMNKLNKNYQDHQEIEIIDKNLIKNL